MKSKINEKINEKINMKRKHFEDEIKDIDKLTLLNGLSVSKDGSVSAFEKCKKNCNYREGAQLGTGESLKSI